MPKVRAKAKATARVHNVIKVVVGELRKQKRRRRRTTTSTQKQGFNQAVKDEVARQISAMPQTGHLRQQSAETGHNLFTKLQQLQKKEAGDEARKQRQEIEQLGRELRWEAVGRADAERIHSQTQIDRLNDRAVKLTDDLKGFSSPLMTSVKPEPKTRTLADYSKVPTGTPVGPIREGEEKEEDGSSLSSFESLPHTPKQSKSLLSSVFRSGGGWPSVSRRMEARDIADNIVDKALKDDELLALSTPATDRYQQLLQARKSPLRRLASQVLGNDAKDEKGNYKKKEELARLIIQKERP